MSFVPVFQRVTARDPLAAGGAAGTERGRGGCSPRAPRRGRAPVTGRPVSSNTTLPSAPTTFCTKIRSWWIPPPAIVEPMFAISSGVIEMTPSVT